MVRAPLKGEDYFCRKVNASAEKVQEAFLEAVKSAITMSQANAMLGDGTITQADTFDPQNVQKFFQQLGNALEDWTFSGVLKSTTEDMHRLYSTFTKEADKFYVSAYFGIQFHELPYYRVDRRVIEIQKELARIEGRATSVLSKMTDAANTVLATELEKRGYANLGFEELFAKMFDDEKLIEELNEKSAVVESQFTQVGVARDKVSELLSELNNLLIKFYQTSPVLIDYNRLMQGEEGITNYFDIEVIKKNKKMKRREAFIDTIKMPKEAADMLSGEIGALRETLRKLQSSF
ncbi:MAG: hypothetical protein QOK66_06975 [Nitrososphaeraceae archaeon]|jgi:hypothetical protein|nr:hypothetical protein [Nitrososphaeraceae archaeon]